MAGPTKKKCQCRSGECDWSPPDRSYCRQNPTCPQLTAPENGRIECPLDSFCVISCNDGFEMINGLVEKTLTCDCDIQSYECQWNKQVPICRGNHFSSKVGCVFRWAAHHERRLNTASCGIQTK